MKATLRAQEGIFNASVIDYCNIEHRWCSIKMSSLREPLKNILLTLDLKSLWSY